MNLSSLSTLSHGIGIFLADNHAGYDVLDKAMRNDCANISNDYSFCDFVLANNGGYVSRSEFLCWFHSAWKLVPKTHLYETYKEVLTEIR